MSDVGRRRDLEYLEESLVNPDADVPVRYRAVEVVTKSGQTVTGIRLNEDDISIQLRDAKDNLRSFLQGRISSEIRYDKPSLMPSVREPFEQEGDRRRGRLLEFSTRHAMRIAVIAIAGCGDDSSLAPEACRSPMSGL